MKKVKLYTDGSSRGNPGPGGYGVILEDIESGVTKECSEGYKLTTNNRMELMAVIAGLEKLNISPIDVEIITDSRYVCYAVEKKWLFKWESKSFKNKKNKDLWKRFLIHFNKHKIRIRWVKGHNNHRQNERCDFLALSASKKTNKKTDHEYEKNFQTKMGVKD